MKKRIFSLVLAVALVMSMATVAIISASAATDSEGRYVPSDTVKSTQRVYFLMPTDWENDYTQAQVAGIYWWTGSDACGSLDGTSVGNAWPGYKAQYEATYDVGSVYYVDLPMNVGNIVWNNYVDGGTDSEAPVFVAAKQTVNVPSEECYDAGDSDLYPDGEVYFDGMIYVCDSKKLTPSSLNEGQVTYGGEWYYYFGDGQYSYYETKEEAEANDALFTDAYCSPFSDEYYKELNGSSDTDDDSNNSDNTDTTTPTDAEDGVPVTTTAAGEPSTDATSSVSGSTADTATSTDNGAIATGDSTMTFVILVSLIAVAGVVAVLARKRMIG